MKKDTSTSKKKSSVLSLQRYAGWVVFIMCFVLYGNTINHKYALDDELNTHLNPQVAQGFRAIPAIFTTVYYQEEGNVGKLSFGYRPLAKATFALEAGLLGSNPGLLLKVSHIVNILLYALTLWLLWIVLRRMFARWNPWFPLAITLLFLAHPLHTEVVASLKNREEILSLLGGLAALHFLLRYADSHHLKFFIFSLLSFAAGFLAKSSIMTFLAIFPLALYFFTETKTRKLLTLSGLFLVVMIAVQFLPRLWLPDQIRPNELVENPLFFDSNLSHRIGTGLVVLLHYLTQLTINPANMAFYYGFDMFPVVSITNPTALFSLAIHLGLLAVAIWQFSQKSTVSFAILFYLITISMYSNIVVPVVGIAADRFLFIPSLAFSMALALAIFSLTRQKLAQWESEPPRLHLFFSVLLPVLLLYSIITINRNSDWKDIPTLYKADINKLERSVKANTQFAGNILYEIFNGQPRREPTREDVKLMLQHFDKALRIKPDYYDALNSQGSIFSILLKQQDEAIKFFKRATAAKPEATAAYINLGFAYFEKGDYKNAIRAYKKVLELEPNRLKAIFKLAEVYQKTGSVDSAILMNQTAMAIDTASEVPYINIGNYYLMQHDTTTAVVWWEKAAHKQPLEQLSKNLSLHFQQLGNKEKAEYYRRKAEEAKGVVIIHR